MFFEWFAFQNAPHLDLRSALPGYLILLALVTLTVAALVRSAADFKRITGQRWFLFVGLLLVSPLLAGVLIVGSGPGGALPAFSVALLGLLPLLAAALWLGPGPAALVGLLIGLTWALFQTGRITQPFEVALLGVVLAAILRQSYRGVVARGLRQPLIAALGGALVVGWPLAVLGVFAAGQATAMAGLERALSALIPALIVNMLSALVAGVIVQAVVMRWPHLHPVHAEDLQAAPWEQRLIRRIMFTYVPLLVLGILLLVGMVAGTSYRVATHLVVDQMARDAQTASGQIPFFVQIGRGLIRDLAQDERLVSDDSVTREARLTQGLRAVPFFQQLIYLDADRNLLNAYPASPGDGIALSAEEASRVDTALEGGVPAEVIVYGQGNEAVTLSFISAVVDPATGKPGGVLLGRTTLDANPILAPVVAVLRQGFVGTGTGFLIDDQNRILLDPGHPEQQEQVFAPTGLREIGVTAGGQAFRQWMPDGTSQLLLMLPVAGLSDWTVVVEVPNEVALALALQIALPTLLLLLALAALSLPLVVTFVQRVAGPLEDLLQAADHIAEGQLDRPVEITGEDEVGQLGRAFEQMRVRLHSRLGEQERLLGVSRSVASSLELFRSMPTILSSALEVTRAIGVRIVLRGEGDRPIQAYSAGEAASAMAILDDQLMNLVERQGTVVISQLWRASGSLDTESLIPRIQALVALPLRSDTSYYGIMWLSYDHEHVFEESEMTFLSTLAGPAAVAVANARLFAEAEEGRRKLEALLESTADAMIATDVHGKIALINPAAKRVFSIAGEHVIGRRADEVIDVPELAALMSDLQEPVAALELPHRQGKILLANTSTIVSHDGAVSGRVAVLRDITALKELDNIKTVFLRMVSHDLRSPLTYMRGYASMLPLSGPLNEKQTEALDRIYTGIDTISQMTERLTYLSRLQFGDEAELELTLVDVAELLKEVVPPQEALARQKDVAIKVEVNGALPLLLADSMLYGHAIMNLINNAVKYTPEQGTVVVQVVMEEDGKHLTVSVTDTGVGIRPEDQARLFEAFYRVPQREGEAQRPRGTGLGLALVKAIAEAHGGSARVKSEFGKGSTFTITLPVRNAAEV